MEANKICNKPDCNQGINPQTPFKLFGKPEHYCSRACVEWAYNEWKSKHKIPTKVLTEDEVKQIIADRAAAKPAPAKESTVDVPTNEFGNAGIVRKFCDNPSCRQAVTLCWKGRNGEYCSNNCLKLTEKQGATKMTDTNDTTATTSPITGGSKKASKKAAAKATKKTAPAKKAAPAAKKATKKAAAPAAEGTGRATSFPKEAVIKHTDTFKTCRSLKGEGTSAARVKAIKDGMTVGAYLDALKKAGLPPGLGNLQACEKGGFVTVG